MSIRPKRLRPSRRNWKGRDSSAALFRFTISKPFPSSFRPVPRGRGLMAKILKFLRNFAYAVAGFGLLILAIGTAEAAGALAVGSCGAYGYGFDYHRGTDARTAAMTK